MLNVRSAAQRIGCSENWVRALLNDNKLDGRKVLGEWLITEESVDKYAAKRKALEEADQQSSSRE